MLLRRSPIRPGKRNPRLAARAFCWKPAVRLQGASRLCTARRHRYGAPAGPRAGYRPLNYLVDTNIISEVRKGAQCDFNVAAWYASIGDKDIYLSVLVLGEIRKEIERARPGNPAQARALENWLMAVARSFGERILPIDHAVADEWGRMGAKRSIHDDALPYAVTGLTGLILATRNVSDVADLGAKFINPFAYRA